MCKLHLRVLGHRAVVVWEWYVCWFNFSHLMTSRTIFNFSSRPCSALRHWDVVEYSAIADSGGARRRSALARSCRAPCHGTLQGRGLLKSHGLSETPIVWRNTSDTFTPRLLWDYYELSSFRLWTVNQFVLRKKVMVDAIPVLADNPRATVLVLVSLYLVPKKTSGETQQSLQLGKYV